MKHKQISFFRLWSGVALLLALAALLAGCSSAAPLTYQNGVYRNDKKGLAFRQAPICYRASSVLEEDGAVACIKTAAGETPLYAIQGADPQKWLADENFTLYYQEGILLPTLAQMQPDRITNSKAGFAISAIEEADRIADLLETYEKGTTVPRDRIIPPVAARYEMVFTSNNHEGMLFVLECWRFEEDVKVYANLVDGKVPEGLYPGIKVEIENGEAVYNLGKTLMYDRNTDRCYPLGNSYNDYFPIG